MILLIHDNINIISVENLNSKNKITVPNLSIVNTLFFLSKCHDEFVIWIHIDIKNELNHDVLDSIFHHKKIMASYSCQNFLPNEIGYANEFSPIINTNKNITYATWFMSSIVGGIHLEIIKNLEFNQFKNDKFNYFLNSVAQLGHSWEGLFCYSEPNLLLNKDVKFKNEIASTNILFKFVYQHQRTRWIFLLLLNFIIYEKKIPILSFINSIFAKKRKLNIGVFDSIEIQSSLDSIKSKDIDVIIPTIGRKKYLLDVLKDLSNQTVLPKNVIIVEQNPDLKATSELDYLHTENWNFNIEHVFINKTGACNARNIALSKVTSEWVFFADDDIRFEKDFFEIIFKNIKQLGCNAVTISCLQKNEDKPVYRILQWPTFGSGCSFVNSNFIKDVKFDMRFEFGYGEDANFGMDLRKKGLDIIYLPFPEIVHIKAPIGGFRYKPVLEWDSEKPKPSPTVLLSILLHKTPQQLKAYKTILFIKYYKNQTIKNPFIYFKKMQKQWQTSIKWAIFLKNNRKLL